MSEKKEEREKEQIKGFNEVYEMVKIQGFENYFCLPQTTWKEIYNKFKKGSKLQDNISIQRLQDIVKIILKDSDFFYKHIQEENEVIKNRLTKLDDEIKPKKMHLAHCKVHNQETNHNKEGECLKCKLDNLVEIAKQIATKAHKGQKRWGGEDYIIHPEAVANSVDKPEEKIVAWLHDVLEDTEVTIEDLLEEGIPEHLVKAINFVSRKKKESYFDFILRCSQNEIAKQVKIADLTHNLSDLRNGSMRDKYLLAKFVLIIDKDLEELKKLREKCDYNKLTESVLNEIEDWVICRDNVTANQEDIMNLKSRLLSRFEN